MHDLCRTLGEHLRYWACCGPHAARHARLVEDAAGHEVIPLTRSFFAARNVEPFPLDELPVELRLHVLTFLDANDLRAMATVSRHYRNFVDDENLWRGAFARKHPEWLPDADPPATWKRLYRDVSFIDTRCAGKLIDSAETLSRLRPFNDMPLLVRSFFDQQCDLIRELMSFVARYASSRDAAGLQAMLRVLRVRCKVNCATGLWVVVLRLESIVDTMLEQKDWTTNDPRGPTLWPPHWLWLLQKTFDVSAAAADNLLQQHGC
eukprot:TRINITY_DN12746_c0_g1_i1.p1 TRINITY_DN12746_c0_g1~~TRINITY_DN12746_c0_g1_i1.p1  ORF type:complete len:263 (-),score=48.24 TRINITY_DN12746_c0_g1_i1:174-962(-)